MEKTEAAVVITGANGGIARAAISLLCDRGLTIFAGVRDETAGASLRGTFGARIVPVVLDVSDNDQIRAAVAAVERRGNVRLLGIVNNAGYILEGPLELLPTDHVRAQFDVNVFGALSVTRAFLPLLRRDKGRIVNIGAISDRLAGPMFGATAASKAALASLNDALRMELHPWGIRVVLIEPGALDTTIFEKAQKQSSAIYASDVDGKTLYADALQSYAKAVKTMKRSSPALAGQAIVEALTAREPQTNYLVGSDAHLINFIRRLPTGLRDKAVRSAMGLP